MLLKFSIADIRPLYEHAKSCQEWLGAYVDATAPGLLLVKDEGAYIMSNGRPLLKEADGECSKVVYADGYRPEYGHIGGDDFVELLDQKLCEQVFDAEAQGRANELHITVRRDDLGIDLVKSQPMPPTPKKPRKAGDMIKLIAEIINKRRIKGMRTRTIDIQTDIAAINGYDNMKALHGYYGTYFTSHPCNRRDRSKAPAYRYWTKDSPRGNWRLTHAGKKLLN